MISNNQTVVSVIVLVYNHEEYIEQCLTSLFEQKVNFQLEFVIGDDGSIDKSEEIINDFIEKYPHLTIHYRRNAVNEGLMKNFKQCFDACTGKYVAICAGDDFWLSEKKLQNQFESLEKKPEFICSSTDTLYLEGNEYRPYSYVESKSSWLDEKVNDEFSFQQLANRFFPHPNTMFFRNQGLLPEYFLDFMCEDYPLFLLLACQGKIHFINEKMTAYRIHAASYVQSKKSSDKDQEYSLRFLEIQFTMLSELNLAYGPQMIVAIENEVKRLMLNNLKNESFLSTLKCQLKKDDINDVLQLNENWSKWMSQSKIQNFKKKIKSNLSKLKPRF